MHLQVLIKSDQTVKEVVDALVADVQSQLKLISFFEFKFPLFDVNAIALGPRIQIPF